MTGYVLFLRHFHEYGILSSIRRDHTVSFKERGPYTAEIIPFLGAFLKNIDPTVMRLEEYWDAFMPILNQISGAM